MSPCPYGYDKEIPMAFQVGDKVQLQDGRKGVVASSSAPGVYAITLDPAPPNPGLHPTQPTDAVPEKYLTKLDDPSAATIADATTGHAAAYKEPEKP